MKYSYYYNHDSDTTKITSVERVNGKLITTTKTLDGNQIPQKTFMPTDLKSWAIVGFVGFTGLNILWTIAPAVIATPIAVFGAFKLTEKRKTNEKVIATVGAGVLSLVLCEMLFKPPALTYSSPPSASQTYTTKLEKCLQIARNLKASSGPCYDHQGKY